MAAEGSGILGRVLIHYVRHTQEVPHIQVKSEEESERLLLETKIIKDDGYQKQQG